MPVNVDETEYYLMLEVCRKANISRATLLRWLKNGIIPEIHRNRKGWRLFTSDDLRIIIAETRRISIEKIPVRKNLVV